MKLSTLRTYIRKLEESTRSEFTQELNGKDSTASYTFAAGMLIGGATIAGDKGQRIAQLYYRVRDRVRAEFIRGKHGQFPNTWACDSCKVCAEKYPEM